MIVIARALVVTEGYAANANDPLIGWANIVTEDNLTADTEEADYPATNLANPSTAERWVAEDDSDQYLTVLTGQVDEIDYVAVARHNFGSLGITVSVEGRATAIDSFSELVEETLLADDAPVLFRFDPASLYEVRLKLQPPTDAIPSAAVMYVGKLLVMPRRIYVGHTPFPDGQRISVVSGRSENGQFLGRIVTGEGTETSASFANLKPLWFRENMRPFVAAANRDTPFFFAWRPGTYPLEVGYAWLTGEARPTNQRGNGMMQIDLAMGGIV